VAISSTNTRFVTLIGAGTALGGFLFGCDTSTLNAAIVGIRPALELSTAEVGFVAAIALIGAVGIVVGELTVALLGSNYGALALSVFLAMIIARALGGARVTIAQAASSAILVVAQAGGEAGPERLFDALIGAGFRGDPVSDRRPASPSSMG
jgi:hypothetical protein